MVSTNRSLLLPLLLGLLLTPLSRIQPVTASAPPAIQYTKTWGGSDIDGGNGVAVDSFGNIYVAGRTDSFGPGSPSQAALILLKYNSSMILMWKRMWSGNGNGSENGWGVAVDPSGNVYVTGSTSSFGAGSIDVLLLKFNSTGGLLWQKTWGGKNTDFGLSVAVDPTNSSNVYVTGLTDSFGAGGGDVLLLKFSSSGMLLWQKTWGGSDVDYGAGVAMDASGNVYVTGYTNSFGAGTPSRSAAFLLKYNSTGSLLWQKTCCGSNGDEGLGVAVDSSGNVYVAGGTGSFGAGIADVLLLKFGSSGSLLWQKTWGGSNYDYATSVAIDASNNIYVTGETYNFGGGVFILKLNSTGSLFNQDVYGAGSGSGGSDIAVTSSGDAFVTGYIDAAPPYNSTNTPGNSTLGTPAFPVGNPSFTPGSPTFPLRTPAGSIATPAGRQIYAGGGDVFLTQNTYRLTLQTNTGTGSVTVNATSYTSGQSVNLAAGSYTILAIPHSGDSFIGWSSSGGIALSSMTSNSIIANLTGTAALTATFMHTVTALTPGLMSLAVLLLIIPVVLSRRPNRTESLP